jgi:hypothetical protein
MLFQKFVVRVYIVLYALFEIIVVLFPTLYLLVFVNNRQPLVKSQKFVNTAIAY